MRSWTSRSAGATSRASALNGAEGVDQRLINQRQRTPLEHFVVRAQAIPGEIYGDVRETCVFTGGHQCLTNVGLNGAGQFVLSDFDAGDLVVVTNANLSETEILQRAF